ncbi:helix-turn-helix domain-containing protein [Nonomuraea sp. NPDC050786]|uniref:helix-turn-helix domain-containing protein n=1 Tax=Nonomuraea sp. NPDC050786 TaxID=3154840 RepID=UPI003409935D
MVRVSSYVKRVNGKLVRVKAYVRSAPGSRSKSDSDSLSPIWLLTVAMLVIAAIFGGIAAGATSSPSTSDVEAAPGRGVAAPAALPPGPIGSLAEALRTARLNSGLSKNQVSTQTGIDESTIDGFERAQIIPNNSDLKKLTPIYGLSEDQWNRLEIMRLEILGEAF